jgi:hypothetical protein
MRTTAITGGPRLQVVLEALRNLHTQVCLLKAEAEPDSYFDASGLRKLNQNVGDQYVDRIDAVRTWSSRVEARKGRCGA